MAGSTGSPLTSLPGSAPAGLGDWQYQIGGVLMGPGTAYLINNSEGFGSPDVRAADVAKVADDGDWMGRDTYASRTVTLTLTVRGATPAAAEGAYQSLLSAWYNDPNVAYTNLWWKWPGLAAQRAIGRPRRIVADKSRLLSGRISVVAEFYSPFSSFFAENVTVTASPLVVTGGGRTYPLTYPKTYTVTATGGTVTATNSGTYPAWPVLTFSGGASVSPRLTDLSTGQYIGFDVALSATDTLVVDLRLRTAFKNGTQNVRQYKQAGAGWFVFPPGVTSSLLYTAASFDSTCACAVLFAPALLG